MTGVYILRFKSHMWIEELCHDCIMSWSALPEVEVSQCDEKVKTLGICSARPCVRVHKAVESLNKATGGS